MNEININTIEKIQSQYKNKTESQFFYNKYIKVLENLKNRLSDFKEPEKIQKVNGILKDLENNREFSIISKQIKELENLLAGYEADKTNIKQWTSKNLDSFQKLWMELEQENKKKEEVEEEKKSSETSSNLDNFEERLRKIVLSWEVDRDQLDQKIDEILSNSEFKDYSEKDKKIVKENILAIAEQKTLDLSKLDKMIDWLYDPKNPKVVKFSNPQTWKTETIEFGSEEDAKDFLYNLKQYVKGELENVYSDEFSEWFLPGTDIRKLINQREFSVSGLVFEWVLYSVSFILAAKILKWNPTLWVWESISRRLWDFTWRWSNSKTRTFSSDLKLEYNQSIAWWMLDGPNKADLQKLQARSDIYDILRAKWETLTWDKQIKFFKELDKIRENFFYLRSNTYVYKMYWLLKDAWIAYDARILFTEWMRAVPDFKSVNPFKWELSPIDSTDRFYWEIWNDKSYESINKWYDLFFQWGTPDEKKLYDRANLTFDDSKFSYFENFLRAEWANDDKVKQIKTYIESLKNKRKSVTEINRVIWLMLKNWDLIHSTEPISKAIGELKLNNGSKKKITLLENFRDKVENHTWLGTKAEFNKTLKQIKDWKITKIPDNFYDETKFPKHTDFVTDGFNKVPEITKAKSEVLAKLGFENNIDWFNKKISDYIKYYVPNDDEVKLKWEFDKFNKMIATEDWYFRKIAEIFGLNTTNRNIISLKFDIIAELNKIKIKDLDVFSNRFKWIENTPQDKLDKIKENYGIYKLKGIVSEDEFKRISKEIENLVNSMSENDYLVWQISHIIDEIIDWKSFNDLENIDWRTIQIDNSKMESLRLKNIISDYNKAKTEVLEKLGFKDNVDWFYKKISDYIWYYVPNDKEKDLKIKFGDDLDKLKNSITDKEWFAKQIADIFDIKTENKSLDGLINEIKGKTDKINIEPSHILEQRFKDIDYTKFQDIENKIKGEEWYKISDLKNKVSNIEFARINQEINKLVNSITTVNWNRYLVWQINYIVDWIIYNWKNFNDFAQIDWRNVSLNNLDNLSPVDILRIKSKRAQASIDLADNISNEDKTKINRDLFIKIYSGEIDDISKLDKFLKRNWINEIMDEKQILEKLKLKVDSLNLVWLKASIKEGKIVLRWSNWTLEWETKILWHIENYDKDLSKYLKKFAKYF